MKTYSLDLRQRIVDAVDNGIGTYSEIAELFGVHESFIYKLLRQRQELGHIAPLPHGGGAHRKLNDKALDFLTDLVKQVPDLTLDELRQQCRKQVKIKVSVSTIWYGLEKRNVTLKKSHAPQKKPILSKEPGFRKNKIS
ncbi:MAG: helix-turn-helix domain-containing protein [bacterium]